MIGIGQKLYYELSNLDENNEMQITGVIACQRENVFSGPLNKSIDCKAKLQADIYRRMSIKKTCNILNAKSI
jgi:hypothetical protein